jgi:AraC-like DNA-binding protein
MDIRLDDGPTARDEIIAGTIGAVRVLRVSSGPGEARRTRSQIGRAESDGYQLFVQAHGSVQATQNGREVELGPGDLSLTELSRPFHCVHPTRSAVLLRFPRPLLPLPEGEVADVLNTRIPGDRGPAALVSTLARRLPGHLDDDTADGGARLGTAVLDLFAAALATRTGRDGALLPGSRRRALLTRVHAFIEARLADPALTPATVADAHFISVRYLHKLFEAERVTVAGTIRRRRLERCRHDLLDPALADRPASAIAARWGLVNPAHFNRLFRDAYHLPPAEFRLRHGGLPDS